LQHQQHDAEAILGVTSIKAILLFENFGAISRQHIKHLPVGVTSLGELSFRLCVDGFVRHNP
jgi:hypothetical protein